MGPPHAAPWLAYALPLVAGVAIWLALRSVSRPWAARWAALRALPVWLQGFAVLGLLWLGVRLARAGWRPLLAFIVLLAVFALWGELAQRAGHGRDRT